jgi:hypothetical protein
MAATHAPLLCNRNGRAGLTPSLREVSYQQGRTRLSLMLPRTLIQATQQLARRLAAGT